ncbi:hypothetical protein D3C86_1998330 [compost metagenome]
MRPHSSTLKTTQARQASRVLCTRCWANRFSTNSQPEISDSDNSVQPAQRKPNSRLSMVCSGGKFLISPEGCLCLSWWSWTSSSKDWNTAMVNMP